ncbi:MAG: transketolase [Lachnospiraceae bacterium]|nr:transketolase [Lachnospiraceae bacterium]
MFNDEIVAKIEEAAGKMRRQSIEMTYAMGRTGAHIGGGLSLIEIMAVLYLNVMKYDLDNMEDEFRDRLIFSKGHGTLALYTAMWQAGILTDDDLKLYKQNDSFLSAHPSMNKEIGVEYSSGSLGQGLSLGVGAALGMKRKGNDSSRVFVILGDGECDEGSIWEAAATASHFGLNNINVVVDMNGLQYDGTTDEVLSMSDMEAKWKSFGFEVYNVDGHSVKDLLEVFDKAALDKSGRPKVFLAKTIKGKGVSFMENNPLWHNGKLSQKQYNQAIEEV